MIIIPMAGMSSRFFKAGYTKPKYMLEAHGKTLFDHSVESFKEYFQLEKFLFVVRDVYKTKEFVNRRCKELGIKDFEVIVLNCETRGQAETVALGLASYSGSSESITIFNIDTFRLKFSFPNLTEYCDGYLEVFQGTGNNWSFVRPISSQSSKIDLTTEKNPISDLCCTGLYYFSSVRDYFRAYEHYLSLPAEKWEKGELYVAPLYNYLISNGLNIHYHQIDREEVVFCGVPEEFEQFKA